MKIKVIMFFVLSTVMVAVSCKNKVEEATNQLYGMVKLYDDGVMIKSDGLEVSLSGIEKVQVTNEKGQYRFEDVPSGSYDISFKKTGFPEYNYYGVQVLPNGEPVWVKSVRIEKIPDVKIENFRDTNTIFSYIYLKADVVSAKTEINSKYTFMLYMSQSADVSNTKYDKLYIIQDFQGKDMLVQKAFKFSRKDTGYIAIYTYPNTLYHNHKVDLKMLNENGEYVDPNFTKISETYKISK